MSGLSSTGKWRRVLRDAPVTILSHTVVEVLTIHSQPSNTMDAVNYSPSFRLHGNYVGPGHTGALQLGQQFWSAPPVDQLDAAARDHDWHYAKHPGNRGAADAILSERAFKSIPHLKSFGAKAKALAVGAGMGLMSKIGSRSNETLTYPPKLNRAAGYKRSRNHLVMKKVPPSVPHVPPPRLVGVEMNPGPKPSKDPMVRAMRQAALGAISRRARKSKSRAGPKITPRRKNTPRQRVPRMNDSGNTYATGVPIVNQTPNAAERLVIRGLKVKLDNITSPSTIIASNEVFYAFLIDRLLFSRTALRPYFMLFDKWKNRGITFTIVPAVATNTAGLVQIVVDPDAADQVLPGTVLDDAFFSGHGRKASEHSVFGPSFQVKLPASNREMFCDTSRILSGANSNDPRYSAAGSVTFAGSTGFALASTQIAAVWATVNAEFYSSAYSEDDGVVACVKAASLAGNTMTAASTSVGVRQIYGQVLAGSPGTSAAQGTAYSEISAMPFFFDGNFFNIPRGNWFMKFYVGLSAAPGTTTFQLNVQGSPIYSSDFITASNQTNAAPPEFALPPNNLVASSGSVQFEGSIRVTAPAPGSQYMQVRPFFGTTNTVSAVTMVVLLMRLPSTISNSFTNQYPLGNSGSVVEFKLGTSESLSIYKPAPLVSTTVSLTRAEYEDWLKYGASRSTPVTMAVSSKDEVKELVPNRLGLRPGWF